MINRNPQEVLAALQEPEAYDGKPPFWEEALAARPPGELPFLALETLEARIKAAGLSADHYQPLADAARTIAADPDLSALAWYLFWRVFCAPEKGNPWGAPSLLKRLGKQAGLFYELLALEFPARLYAYHLTLGYPPEATEETIKQITAFEGNHLRGRGSFGIYECQFPWFATYLVQPYVRLGRLEYQLHSYGGGVQVWRRSSDGAVLALAEDGARVAANGLLLSPDAPAGEGWQATLVESAQDVRGFPIAPTGYVSRERVCLLKSHWQLYLQKGDLVLDLHIPAGGGMEWPAVVDSFNRALAFFRRHHPAQRWRALVVRTWFLDPQLNEVLPPLSNPLRFQRAVYLYPIPADPGSLWFVFLRPIRMTPLSELPADTSLQKSLLKFLATGRQWHGGGMFILPEHMAKPEENFYRAQYARTMENLIA